MQHTDKNEMVYIDSQILPAAKARVSVFDRGLNYGDGLFESMRASKGRAVLLKKHIKRLKSGARLLEIPSPSLKGLSVKGELIGELLKANNLTETEAVVKIILTRGSAKRGHGRVKKPSPTLIVTATKLDTDKLVRLKKKGVKAILTEGRGIAVSGVKSLNFLPGVLARAEAEKRRVYEALFVDAKGYLLEGSSTNIFLIKKGCLLTPPADGRILEGITRELVIEFAKKAGLKVAEKPLKASALKEADEAFLTNSIIEIVPLLKVDETIVNAGSPGPLTQRLQLLYASNIKE
jgi:D-amino acid aminotransferase